MVKPPSVRIVLIEGFSGGRGNFSNTRLGQILIGDTWALTIAHPDNHGSRPEICFIGVGTLNLTELIKQVSAAAAIVALTMQDNGGKKGTVVVEGNLIGLVRLIFDLSDAYLWLNTNWNDSALRAATRGSRAKGVAEAENTAVLQAAANARKRELIHFGSYTDEQVKKPP